MEDREGESVGAKSLWMQLGIGTRAPVKEWPRGGSTDCSSITHGGEAETWAQM